MKILITGGAGFLGMHLASFFNKKKYQLLLIDIARFNKKDYPRSADLITTDIRDKYSMYRYIKKADVVIHAAAALPLWPKKDIFEINVEGTKNILHSCQKSKVKRAIFISSTAVYGIPKRHPIYESDQLIGVGSYGQSKIEAEKLCFQSIKNGLNVTIIRPKTFVGTGRLGVFEILFDWIYDGKKIPVIGSGQNRYQLLDVDDLVEAVYLFIKTYKKEYNDVFNIAAEKFSTVEEDLNQLFNYAYKQKTAGSDKINKKSMILSTPAFFVKKALWLFEKLKLSPLYQWVYDTADKDSFVSIKRIVETLNWHPKYSNAEALIKAYQWYLDNYKKIKSHPAGLTHTVGWKQGILGWFKRLM